MQQFLYVIIGIVAGVFSGIFGIGGGTILIPALVFFFSLTQHQAQGTTLAIMVLPIGLMAAYRYYVSGNVKLAMALWICLGFFIGGYVGATIAHLVDDNVLKKAFGVFLLIVSLKMIFIR